MDLLLPLNRFGCGRIQGNPPSSLRAGDGCKRGHRGLILSPEFVESLPQFCFWFLIRLNNKLHSYPTQATFEGAGGNITEYPRTRMSF